MSKGLYFVTFVAGAVVGVIATGAYFKKKYETIANEEIESVREVFSKYKEDTDNEGEPAEEELEENFEKVSIATKEAISNMKKISNANDYSGEGHTSVITPEEFEESDDYEKVFLTYYADEVLTDDNDDIIYDIDDVVGEESLKTFGQYENDCVFVKNEKYKCVYEIARDNRTYDEVCGGGHS